MNGFLISVVSYSLCRVNEESGIARMIDLIKEHPKLLLGLRFFRPATKITIPPKPKITKLPKANCTIPLKIKITIPKASRTIPPPKAEKPTNSDDELNFMNMLKVYRMLN